MAYFLLKSINLSLSLSLSLPIFVYIFFFYLSTFPYICSRAGSSASRAAAHLATFKYVKGKPWAEITFMRGSEAHYTPGQRTVGVRQPYERV